jgi:hypothetical protein
MNGNPNVTLKSEYHLHDPLLSNPYSQSVRRHRLVGSNPGIRELYSEC